MLSARVFWSIAGYIGVFGLVVQPTLSFGQGAIEVELRIPSTLPASRAIQYEAGPVTRLSLATPDTTGSIYCRVEQKTRGFAFQPAPVNPALTGLDPHDSIYGRLVIPLGAKPQTIACNQFDIASARLTSRQRLPVVNSKLHTHISAAAVTRAHDLSVAEPLHSHHDQASGAGVARPSSGGIRDPKLRAGQPAPKAQTPRTVIESRSGQSVLVPALRKTAAATSSVVYRATPPQMVPASIGN